MGQGVSDQLSYHWGPTFWHSFTGIPQPNFESPADAPLVKVAPQHTPNALPRSFHPFQLEQRDNSNPNQHGEYIDGVNYPPWVETRKRLLDAGFLHPIEDPLTPMAAFKSSYYAAIESIEQQSNAYNPAGLGRGVAPHRRYVQDDIMDACIGDRDRSWPSCVQQAWARTLLGETEKPTPKGQRPEDLIFTHLGYRKAVEPLFRGLPYERDQHGRRVFHWQRRDAVTATPVGGWDKPDPMLSTYIAHPPKLPNEPTPPQFKLV
eukprot:NODE_2776_length_1042_cov_11.511581_g2321_i0.p2 GENE.NODE_2776_length_1042_cov_11.511581_g2321_i0~~NODE_2776_length_1042_cov_11.511581_g2321_i0.p2  ORF type:complete len:262 (-),score=26.20 NODE_2776_length_1042_cov_11.511581_g2321_i0:101-886(-)